MRIQINERGVTNLKAGLTSGEIGEINYPDDPKYRGWLDGQIARGAVSLVAEEPCAYSDAALGPTAGSTPETSEPAPVAEAPAEPKGDDIEQTFADGAEGLTIGSTPGPAVAEVDLEKDLADADVTQHPEKAEAAHGKPGAKNNRRR